MSEPLDIDKIESRAKAATPGPWVKGSSLGSVMTESRLLVATLSLAAINSKDFIAHAREDVPALIARVRELEEELRPDAKLVEAQAERDYFMRELATTRDYATKLEKRRDALVDACVRLVRDAQLQNLDGDKARRLAENVQALLVPLVGDGT